MRFEKIKVGMGVASFLLVSSCVTSDAVVERAEAEIILANAPNQSGSMAALFHSEQLCSATVIAPRVVLTAGHCAPQPGHSLYIGATSISPVMLASASAEQVSVLGADGVNDLALILLDRDVPGPYQGLTDRIVGLPETPAMIKGYGRNEGTNSISGAISLRSATVVANRKTWAPSDPWLFNHGYGELCGTNPEGVGMHCIQQDYVASGENYQSVRPTLPMIESGDSGGPIVNSVGRQFGVTSFGPFVRYNATYRLEKPYHTGINNLGARMAGYFAPVRRGWIDATVRAWDADENECYPNWPDTPAMIDGACRFPDTQNTASPSGIDQDGLDNENRLCSRAELNAILAHNQQILGLLQAAIVAHNASFQHEIDAWNQAYEAWFETHPGNEILYGDPSMDAIVGPRPVIPPFSGAQPFLDQLKDASGCALEIAMSDAGIFDLNAIDNCQWHELFFNAAELINPTGQPFVPGDCALTNNLTPPQFSGPCSLLDMGYADFQYCLWNQFHFLDDGYIHQSGATGTNETGTSFVVPPELQHVEVYIGNTFMGSWNYTSYPGITPCFQWIPGATPGGAIYPPTAPQNPALASFIGSTVGTCN